MYIIIIMGSVWGLSRLIWHSSWSIRGQSGVSLAHLPQPSLVRRLLGDDAVHFRFHGLEGGAVIDAVARGELGLQAAGLAPFPQALLQRIDLHQRVLHRDRLLPRPEAVTLLVLVHRLLQSAQGLWCG